MKPRILGLVLVLVVAGCERVPAPQPRESTPPSSPIPPPVVAPTPAPLAEIKPDSPVPQARRLKDEAKLLDARTLLQPAADAGQADAMALLGEINTQLLFSPLPAPEKADCTIASGDTLGKLAKQYTTTVDLIKKGNGLTGDVIRIGNRLRIYQGQFAVIVSKKANTLTLTDHGKFFKQYRVGTGEYSKTPVGEFKIATRQQHPVWYRGDKEIPYGDPENILGTHWLGLDTSGYGLHGTWQTNTIGQAASAGCVRMLNDDIAELFIILPLGTPVTIRE